MLRYDNCPGPRRETCLGSAHSAQLQTQQRGDETRLIMTDRHQGHSALPYRPAPNSFIHKNRGLWQFWTAVFWGGFAFFFLLPSWAPDGGPLHGVGGGVLPAMNQLWGCPTCKRLRTPALQYYPNEEKENLYVTCNIHCSTNQLGCCPV